MWKIDILQLQNIGLNVEFKCNVNGIELEINWKTFCNFFLYIFLLQIMPSSTNTYLALLDPLTLLHFTIFNFIMQNFKVSP